MNNYTDLKIKINFSLIHKKAVELFMLVNLRHNTLTHKLHSWRVFIVVFEVFYNQININNHFNQPITTNEKYLNDF